MKKILLVALEYPPMVGGVGEYYRGLVDASDGEIIPFVGEQKLYWNFFPQWLPMLWRIPREMKRVGTDVVFAGEILPVGTVLWILNFVSSYLRIFVSLRRYSLFVHGLDLALTGRKRWIATRVLRRATWVIANSEYTKKIVLGYGIDPKKVTVLTPCPSVDVNPRADASYLHIPVSSYPSPWRLLTIARFVERKGYDTAVRVAAELKKQGKKFQWTFVGDGPDRSRIEALVKELDVSDCIQFEHSVKAQQLADFYQKADCFVFLPRELPNGDVEGFGMVCLEALLYGLPVVASKSGGVPEAVVDGVTGVLTSTTDIQKIAEDITSLMQDSKKRQAMGTAGRERVLKEFQWKDRFEVLQNIIT